MGGDCVVDMEYVLSSIEIEWYFTPIYNDIDIK